MEIIHWLTIILGFSIVGTGLRSGYNFTKNEEKKKNMIKMAYEWKAKIEEDAIKKNVIKLKEAA